MALAHELETHLTVAASNGHAVAALARWAAAEGLKCLHILLQRGATPSQPMLTRKGYGSLAEELAAAQRCAARLAAAGFVVLRIKIEAHPSVPDKDTQAARLATNRYFEQHVRLLLSPAADVASLLAVAEQHGAHLSRNALRARLDGAEERFLTQRGHLMGRAGASARLQELLAALRRMPHIRILHVEEELVLYDSNLALDDGWLTAA